MCHGFPGDCWLGNYSKLLESAKHNVHFDIVYCDYPSTSVRVIEHNGIVLGNGLVMSDFLSILRFKNDF